MNGSDWTPSPITEREMSRLRWKLRWGSMNVVWAALSSVAAMVVTVIGFNLVLVNLFGGLLAFVAALSFGVLVFVFAIHDNARLVETKAPDEAKRTEFGAGEGWLVDLIVLQGAAPTGKDRGMLWIEGGRLCFSGDRTSFALAPGGVMGSCRREHAVGGLRYRTRLSLDHPHGLALSFDVEGDVLGSHSADARQAIDTWIETESTQENQFPPTRVGPGAPSRQTLFVGATLTTAYWAGLLALANASLLDWGAAGIVLVLGGFLGWLLGCWPVGLRWRALRDRLRVER